MPWREIAKRFGASLGGVRHAYGMDKRPNHHAKPDSTILLTPRVQLLELRGWLVDQHQTLVDQVTAMENQIEAVEKALEAFD
jgi:hypothetical protein